MQDSTSTVATVPVGSSAVVGYLKWVADYTDHGSRAIAIKMAGSSREELVGIKLTKSVTKKFDEEISETIFKGRLVTVTLLSDDVASDLANGIGSKSKDYFIGTSIKSF